MRIIKLIVLWIASIATGAYFLRRRIFAIFLGLRQPQFETGSTQHLKLTTRDGITLTADHHYPVTSGQFPTILIRTPYGRRLRDSIFGGWLWFFAKRFAERGYNVLVQDTRGRFDSEGEFEPYINEKKDGQDTIEWLRQQSWFNGELAMWGPSYLGLVQWAIANEPEIKALAPSITGSELYNVIFPDGSFDMALTMRWMAVFELLEASRKYYHLILPILPVIMERKLQNAFYHLPLDELDEKAFGHKVAFFQDWKDQFPPHNERWLETFESVEWQEVNAPVHLVGGWHDFFLRQLLADYDSLRKAGKNPYLTIGPWYHFENAFIMVNSINHALKWFDHQFKGKKLRKKPVRVFVGGIRKWREMDEFPPPCFQTSYFLQPNQTLRKQPSKTPVAKSCYRYDPSDPTPIIGGTQFHPYAGSHDNRQLETRDDVLTFTTDPLTKKLELIGFVKVVLYVHSSLEHTDFYACVTDVHPNGKSMNICEGLYRIEPHKGERLADDSIRIEIDLWATGYHFKEGHCIRLQVSSGAHPRWSRNLGTGDPFSTNYFVADQTVFHDAIHPSALILPITEH